MTGKKEVNAIRGIGSGITMPILHDVLKAEMMHH